MFHRIKTTGVLFTLFLTMMTLPAQASLSVDLPNLLTQGATINTNLSLFNFTDQSCSDLGLMNQDIEEFIASTEAIITSLTAPVSVSTADLDALDALSWMTAEMGANGIRLSMEVQDIAAVADLFEYRAALSAMLELSADIGTMADRILEMADRILIMADNIGTMADRILMTQQIQSTNLALTQASLLTTQQNMILLSTSVSSILYNVTLGQIDSDSNTLLDNMTAINLTSTNMAQELERLETTTAVLVSGIDNLSTWVSLTSQSSSHAVDGDTLTTLGNLTLLHADLAYFLESYGAAVSQLAPVTDTIILSDATAAMLRLTADIGLMAGRIIEMTDKIIVMADNIGLMADNIVATQTLQQTNIELSESSLLTAQNATINVIKNLGL